MADVQSNIQVSIDTTQALASIKNLQRQISAFHSSMAKGGAAANAVSAQLQQTLINSVNASGQFSAGIRTIRTTTESFTSSLERNKFSLGEYFRYAGGATKTFGRLFKTEHDTINKVARENVKDLQTQYIRLGRDASGAMKSIAVRPLSLDMTDLGTRTQIAAQKQAIFNQLLKQGSTNLLNFGKNTQWAGRQLMVGFTLPLIAVGSAAAKTFMDMETQAIRFKKVYGDLFTPTGESQQALKDIQELGKEFTKYGIAVSSTVGLAAEAAAAGFKGVDLTRQTTAATRLSILGQVESQKALETTIALQNAFSMSSQNLAESIDFLNAVENQTVLSLDDMSTAIPKAAPVVQQLGGDVKDLAFLMTAMKEGGINASEGANALKSGLASLINPTGKANDMLLSFGINAKKIVEDNKGDLKKTVIEFATALNQLDPLNRAQTIEQMFGKFQFARLSTLFANVTKEGTQAARVLDLAGASVQELASLSEKELGMTSESAMNKFKGAVESLKLSLIPLGEEFLKAITPIAEFITRILEKFDGLGSGTKKAIVIITAVVAGLGPVLLMTFGLIMNGLANMIKLFAFLKSAFNKTGQSTTTLGTEVKYMTAEQRNAAAVAASLDQVHTKLAQTFTSEASAVNALTRAYQRAIAAQSQFVPVAPPITRGPIKKFAGGKPATVGGTGNKDSELALLMPGETVIPTAMSQKYGSIINAMIADKIPGYEFGKTGADGTTVPIYPENAIRLQPAAENMAGRASTTTVPQVLSPLALRIGEARGIAPTLSKVESGSFDAIYNEYKKITTDFVKRVNLEYNTTFKDIKDENERMRKAWSAAGKAVEKQVDSIASPKDRAVVRKAFGLVDDDYATIPTDSREAGGTSPNRSRRGAFKSRLTGLRSYTRIRPGAKRLYERMTGKSAANLQMGHVFPPRAIDLATLEADPRKSGSVATARAVTERGRQDAEAYEAGKKKGKIKDPYVTSTESTRRSPHPQAAKDGKDDARAYSTARDEELKKSEDKKRRQSGRVRRVATRSQGAPSAGSVTQEGSTFIATGGGLTEKEERRRRRSASRKQGPAAIGATPLPGMRILPIVSPLTEKEQRREERRSARKQFLNKAKVSGSKFGTRLAGGTAILGANMALSAAPDFAGKDVIQGTMTGASLGMLFGPWGIAAGAAIGLVTSALGNLIEKQKQHKAMTEAMFKSSSSVAEFFGNAVVNTTMEVGRLSSATLAASSSTENLGKNFGYTNEELQRFSDLVNSLPQGDPLKDILVGLEDVTDPEEIKTIIDNFVTTQVAVGQTLPEQAQKIYDLILAQSGNQSMVGQSFYNFKTQSEAVSATLKNARKNSVDLGNSLIQLTGAASNSSSLIFIKSIIDGIAASGISAAEGLNAMYYAYLRIGNQGAADSLQNLRRIKGLTQAEINDLMISGTQGFSYPVGKDTTRKEILEAQAEFKKTLKEEDPLESGIKPYRDLADEKTSSIKKEIDLLKKRKKIIDDQIKKEKQITDELKKQNDYRDKQLKIDKDIVEAKIRGDYIEAAILLQEKTNLTDEFNKENQLSALQARSDALQQQIEERQSVSDDMVAAIQSTTDAVTTGSANIVTAVREAGGFPSIDGDGSFKAPLTVASDTASIKSYIESEKPSAGVSNEGVSVGTVAPSAIDAAKAYNETFGEKITRLTQPGLKTEMQMLEDYIRTQIVFPPDKKHIFIEIKGSDGLFYKFKVAKDKNAKNGFIRVGDPIKKAAGGYIENFMGGGNVRGAGTETSDSIPALLSNGEYVVKAKSVKKYGVGTLDALNAGRFATGGQVGRSATSYVPRLKDGGSVKDGFMQRWSKSISGSPLAEMMGTAQLLRLISGQGKKGDNLGAAKIPLNLLGSGFGSKIMGNLGKSAFYLPNKINQMMNQRKVNSMLKSGVFHGSQPVGFRGEEYLQGTNILDGSMSTDPYYGMGFFGTTSKAEARLYASGYNSTNNWGESFGSMNQIIGAPRGKYVDFTRGPKSLKWQDYGLAKSLGKSMPENLGDLMNAQGLTGGIMNRVSSGRTPEDIMYAKWLAFSNPAGVMTKEIGYKNGGLVPGYDKGGLATSPYGPYVPSFKVFNPNATGSMPKLSMPVGSTATTDMSVTPTKMSGVTDFIFGDLTGLNSFNRIITGKAHPLDYAAVLPILGVGARTVNAVGRSAVEMMGIRYGIPGLGSLLPKGSIPYAASMGSGAIQNAALATTLFGSKLANIGISDQQIAQMASEKAAAKIATRQAKEQAGIGFRGTLNRLADNPFLSQTLPMVSTFKPKQKAIKQKQKSGEDLSDYEIRLRDATAQAQSGNFTPIEKLRSLTHAQLVKELDALVPETGFTPDGQFRYEFIPAKPSGIPNPELMALGIKNHADDPLNAQEFISELHRLNFHHVATGKLAAEMSWDSITGSIRGMFVKDEAFKRQGIGKFANAFAAARTRLQHSKQRTPEGRRYSESPAVTGLLPGHNVSEEIPLLRDWANRLGIKPIVPYVPPKPLSDYEVLFDQQRGFTPDSSGLFPSGFRHANPNPREPYIDPHADEARRRILVEEEARRRAALEALSSEEIDRARLAWRGDPNRTYGTYPFNPHNGAYDMSDAYDLEMLMKLPSYHTAPAGVPYRPNSQRPQPMVFSGKDTSAATGGLIDKGKVRVPKFANGGLIKGPGTGISDSITAGFGYAGGGSIRVSNGEYVVKASSVKDYGVDAMNAVNNGTATIGTNSGGTVYNINMPITSNNANPEGVANEVMRRLKLEVSKNNKSNKVGL
jgi:TP901 family phage tail tape measure protein